ncbi:MAG TPA: response regulator [Acidimicrobiales bacterium]|nr:response regulator [Acidimicrobiales bacterium]
MIRVLLVDDNADVRFLLRLTVELRPGLEVVAEATNGLEALRLAAETSPDIVILDREMPVAGGLEVLARLREACPTAVIVVYTAAVDPELHRAAASLGADGVRTKGAQSIDDLLDDVSQLLLPGGSGGEELVRVRVGPVAAGSARLWVANTRNILDALRAAPAEIPAGVPTPVLTVFGSILDEWAAVAEGAGDGSFFWSAAARVATIEALVVAWAQLDTLSDDAMARLGCRWSPAEATPFFDALTGGVVTALRRHEELKALVTELPTGWAQGARSTAVDGPPHSD